MYSRGGRRFDEICSIFVRVIIVTLGTSGRYFSVMNILAAAEAVIRAQGVTAKKGLMTVLL